MGSSGTNNAIYLTALHFFDEMQMLRTVWNCTVVPGNGQAKFMLYVEKSDDIRYIYYLKCVMRGASKRFFFLTSFKGCDTTHCLCPLYRFRVRKVCTVSTDTRREPAPHPLRKAAPHKARMFLTVT
ncbi:hypothetical protein MTO96_040766 [Rhipicephalus appendiculatus]